MRASQLDQSTRIRLLCGFGAMDWHQRWRRTVRALLVGTLIAAVSCGLAPEALAVLQPACSFAHGFQAIQSQIPEVVGDCLENERFNPANGNTEQRTTGGLLVWRKADNWTAFTDGHTTWVNGPDGLQNRPNAERFPWEPAAAPPPAPVPEAPIADGVLLAHDFGDPAADLFEQSWGETRFEGGYADGEYLVRRRVPDASWVVFVKVPGYYANAVIAVDARLVGRTEQRHLVLGCRDRGESRASEYRFIVQPATGSFLLIRMDEDEGYALTSWQQSPAIKRGEQTNRLELSCAGSTISASANGELLATVQDSTYPDGFIWFGVGSEDSANVVVEGRFDNLVISER